MNEFLEVLRVDAAGICFKSNVTKVKLFKFEQLKIKRRCLAAISIIWTALPNWIVLLVRIEDEV